MLWTGVVQIVIHLYPPKSTMDTAGQPKFNAVPTMARHVTDSILIQMSVGLEMTMQRKSPFMKPMRCAHLPGTDYVEVRKK